MGCAWGDLNLGLGQAAAGRLGAHEDEHGVLGL